MANRKHIAIKFVIWTIFVNFFLQEAHGNEIVPNATELPVHLTSGYLEPGTVDDIQRTTPLGEKTYSLGEVMTLAKQMNIYQIGQKFENVIVPLTCMLGLVGNTLSALVVFQKDNRRVTCYFYMGALAVTDSIFLTGCLIYWLLIEVIQLDIPYDTHSLLCSVVWPIGGISALSGTYIIIAMTFDRLIAVKWPLKSLTWCTLKRARITVLCLILFATLVKLPYVWITKPVPKCLAFQVEGTPLLQAYYWINLSASSYVPFTILLVLNVLIIQALQKRRNYFPEDRSTINQSDVTSTRITSSAESGTTSRNETVKFDKKAKVTKSLTRMLMLIAFSFLIITIPYYLFYLIFLFISPFTSPKRFAIYYLVSRVTGRMYIINFAINFYLYCLGGSKFRKDLKKILDKLCRV